MSLRQAIKSATGLNVWTRYAFLVPWRAFYAAAATLTRSNHASDYDCPAGYAANVFADYKLWAGVDRFYGRIAEVGTGPVSAVADLFLADGCSSVDQVEPYTYGLEKAAARVYRYHLPAEKFFLSHRGYDFIVSRAVMEHVQDPLAALRAMADALAPGGMMIHAVDCRDHGWFSDKLHDLSFLRIPLALYGPLNTASGLNRLRMSAYLSTLNAAGLACRTLVTSLSGIPEPLDRAQHFSDLDSSLVECSRKNLANIKTSLATPFREMMEEDLLVSGFVIVAVRPAERVIVTPHPKSAG